jgi:hypothetical protein
MKFDAKSVRSGQVRPYGDTVSEWSVESDGTPEEVMAQCLRELAPNMPVAQRSAECHSHGTCGFPFGLDSFYTFAPRSNGTFRFCVVWPYCD